MKKVNVFAGFYRTNEAKESHPRSCEGGHPHHQENDPCIKSVFQCPVKCEGDKTYIVPGNCPVCNMNLEQTDEVQEQYYL